jgi:hypothetical protein
MNWNVQHRELRNHCEETHRILGALYHLSLSHCRCFLLPRLAIGGCGRIRAVVKYEVNEMRVVRTCPTLADTENTWDNADMPCVVEVDIPVDAANVVSCYTLLLAVVQQYSKMSSYQRKQFRVVNLLLLFHWNCSVK